MTANAADKLRGVALAAVVIGAALFVVGNGGWGLMVVIYGVTVSVLVRKKTGGRAGTGGPHDEPAR